MIYSVYKITNTITGKLYFGITSKSIKERFDSHVSASVKRTTKIGVSICEYGSDKFLVELVRVADSRKEAAYWESFYIQKYNTVFPNGLNGALHDNQNYIKYTSSQMVALADAFVKSFWTIERWIKNNDDRLTSDKAKQVLSEN